jgi:O-antigen/teichoic acid export membrane protein
MAKRQLLNVLSNFAGVGTGLVFPLLFNIAYYRLLGTEAYGLIGFFGLLLMLASLLDLGLSQTTSREIARGAIGHDHAGDLQSLVLTLGMLSCGAGFMVCLLTAAASRWLATSWLSRLQLSVDEVATAITMMGGILAISFPANIFNAALRGLQRQALSNSVAIVSGAGRGAATVAALYLFGSTAIIFFAAQLLLSLLELSLLGSVVWALLPRSPTRPRFNHRLVQANWRFAFAVWLSGLSGQLIMLSDKAVMSTVLSLDLFGLYSLAFAVASAVQRLSTPFSTAYFPHFVELVEKRDNDLLSQSYYLSTRLASAVVLCAGLVMAIYAPAIMLLLTGNRADAAIIASVFTILVAANTISSLTVLPQMLQLACGAAWIALRINSIQTVPYVILLLLLAPRFGMYAPASLWLAASLMNFPIIIFMTHRVALQGQAWAWFKRAILPSAISATTVLLAAAALQPTPSPLALISWLAANYALALGVALFFVFRTPFTLFGSAKMR